MRWVNSRIVGHLEVTFGPDLSAEASEPIFSSLFRGHNLCEVRSLSRTVP
jgi:hypothetical protein